MPTNVDWLEFDDDVDRDAIPESPDSHEALMLYFRTPILRKRYRAELVKRYIYHDEDGRERS